MFWKGEPADDFAVYDSQELPGVGKNGQDDQEELSPCRRSVHQSVSQSSGPLDRME